MPDPSDERRARLKAAVQREPSMRVRDPMLADMVEVESPAPMGGADKEATRLTMRIPGENTLLNLGAAEPSRSLDEGIHGWTDNHVLFQTAAHQTMVNLGGKATNGGYTGSLGYAGTTSVGYGMFTGGRAWHESVQSQYVITQKGEIIVRSHAGGSFLIQSDQANGTIATGGGIAVGAQKGIKIVADSGVKLERPGYGDDIEGTVDEATDRSVQTWSHAILDQAQAISGIVRGVVPMKDWPQPGEKGFGKHALKGMPPLIADSIKLGLWIGSVLPGAENTITLNAKEGFGAAAQFSTMWGSLGALVGSTVTADVVGATAGVKAGAYAGIWAGVAVSVEGLAEVSLSAPLGEVSIDGKKDVGITSKTGNVLVGAGKSVDVSSPKTLVYGENQVKVIAGGGDGMGILARPGNVFLGSIDAGGDRYGAATANADHGMVVSESGIGIELESTTIKMSKSKIENKTKNYTVDASKVTIKASGKVLLG